MRILWIPQISSKDKNGTVLLNKDSNMAVLRNLIDTEFCKENDIDIALEYSRLNCIIDDDIEGKFKTIYTNDKRVFTNALMERFCFDADFFEKISTSNCYDVVFVNEPTKVVPLRHIFKDSKIVTYNHWLAMYNMSEIELRQLEGMRAADICFVNSDYTIKQIKEHYGLKDDDAINLIKAQPSFTGNIMQVKGYPGDKFKGFIYNHRLSSDSYYKSAYDTLVNICDIAEEQVGKENMPIVWFTNPSGKDIEFPKSYFKSIDLPSQEEYNAFLESEYVYCHLNTFFESKGMWSMSTVDCARTGNICLLPRKYGYAEIFNDSYKGYCNDKPEMASKMVDIIQGKYDALDYSNYYIGNHKAENIGKLMNNKLKELFK